MIIQSIPLREPFQFEQTVKLFTPEKTHYWIKPTYLSICQADLRYFLGQRPWNVLQKLPLCLIHEASGVIVHAPEKAKYPVGTPVCLIPLLQKSRDDQFIGPNYHPDNPFYSSDIDGFTQEYWSGPVDNLLPCLIPDPLACLMELFSVAHQAVAKGLALQPEGPVSIWGSGSLAYLLALYLKFAKNKTVYVIGRSYQSLNHFDFVDHCYYFHQDHPIQTPLNFEAIGGAQAPQIISELMDIVPACSTIVCLGVNDLTLSINTRTLLSKGLTVTGVSRSCLKDFETVIAFVQNHSFLFPYLKRLIAEIIPITNAKDLNQAFSIASSQIQWGKVVLQWHL